MSPSSFFLESYMCMHAWPWMDDGNVVVVAGRCMHDMNGTATS